MQNFTTIWQRTRNRLETIVGTMLGVLLLFLLWTWISENLEAWERAHRISTPTGGIGPGLPDVAGRCLTHEHALDRSHR